MKSSRNSIPDPESLTFGSVIREVGTSVKDLVRSEIDLVKAEVKDSSRSLGRHAGQAAAFGALTAISVLPFLAFLVIGLGRLMNGNYWLSSLIVAALCAAIGGPLAYRAFRRIKEHDLPPLPRTSESLERAREVVAGRSEALKETASERIIDIREPKRRRSI